MIFRYALLSTKSALRAKEDRVQGSEKGYLLGSKLTAVIDERSEFAWLLVAVSQRYESSYELGTEICEGRQPEGDEDI